LGAKVPRVRLEDFSYDAPAEAPLEVPLGERIAAIRARKAQERARAAAKSAGRTAEVAKADSSRPRRRRFGRGHR
jgi:ATP-dependent RNA helicase RhlE